MQQNPALLIADPKRLRAPRIPKAGDPQVTLWSSRQGVVGGLSHIVNEEPWLHILGVASYKLDVAKNSVTAVPWEHAPQEAIFDAFQSTVWPTFLQIQGCEVLHGSAVIGSRGVVAFCAASETGKSTLAYALGQRGYAPWADDAVVIKLLPHSVKTRSLPFFLRLRSASALYFGYAENQVNAGRVQCKGPQRENALPLITICLLEQVQALPDNRAVTIRQLCAAEALVGVLDHALYFGLQDQARKRRMVEQYLTLIRRVPVYKVSFCCGLDRLTPILDQLERRFLAPMTE